MPVSEVDSQWTLKQAPIDFYHACAAVINRCEAVRRSRTGAETTAEIKLPKGTGPRPSATGCAQTGVHKRDRID